MTEIIISCPDKRTWIPLQQTLFKQGCEWRNSGPILLPYPSGVPSRIGIIRSPAGKLYFTRDIADYDHLPSATSEAFLGPIYTLL